MNRFSKYPCWSQKIQLFTVIAAASMIIYFAAHYYVHLQDYYNSDFFKLWLGGNLIAKGLDPYNIQTWMAGHDVYNVSWRPNPTYLYPLPLAIFFIPLTLLPFVDAYVLWAFLSIWAIIGTIHILLKLDNSPRIYHLALPLLAGAFLFRPTIVSLRNGQLGPLLLIILSISIYLWQKDRWFAGGAFMALMALKPQLGIPLLALFSLWLILQNRWLALLGSGFTGMLLLLVGLVINPNWPAGFIDASSQRFYETFSYSPTLWGVAGILVNHDYRNTLLYGSIASILLVALVAWLLFHHRIQSPSVAVAVLIPVALLITPYSWVYDQILLIVPISLVTVCFFKQHFPYLFSAFLLLIIDIIAIALLVLAISLDGDMGSAVVPSISLLLVMFVVIRNFHRSQSLST
jgi:hypothetical protein